MLDLNYFSLEIEENDSEVSQELTPTDRILFLVGCPASIVFSLILIIGFIKCKNLRKRPGDLILGISISDLCLSMIWFIIAVNLENNICETYPKIAMFGIFVAVNSYLYNCWLCIYFIKDLQNVIKQSKIPTHLCHYINIIAAATVAVYLNYNNELETTLYGICLLKNSPYYMIYLDVLIMVFYIFIHVFTFIYI